MAERGERLLKEKSVGGGKKKMKNLLLLLTRKERGELCVGELGKKAWTRGCYRVSGERKI